MLSPNGLLMLHKITLPFKNFSLEFMRVSCFYLGYFKTWGTLQVCIFFKIYESVHHVLKQPFLSLKSLWCLGYNKYSAYELSCYTYSKNYCVKFESYIILYFLIKASFFHYSNSTFMPDFFVILGELTCVSDIDLSWIDIDILKARTSVTNTKLPNNFTPLFVSLGDLYKTNRKLFIQIEAKIQQNDVFISVEKTPESPSISFTEALMTSSTHFPKEKTRLHFGNIRWHKFIKFLKRHKSGVSGTALETAQSFCVLSPTYYGT